MAVKRNKFHKHKFRLNSYSGVDVTFRCVSCGERTTRKTTAEEKKAVAKRMKSWWSNDIHAVCHKFFRAFLTRKPNSENEKFKLKGYKLMCALERFAKRNPTVQICWCDDNCHCGSLMALIPHENKNQYWGTTVVIAPQHGEPTIVFLYPCHHQRLLSVLTQIDKKFRAKEPHRIAKEKKEEREFMSHGFKVNPRKNK